MILTQQMWEDSFGEWVTRSLGHAVLRKTFGVLQHADREDILQKVFLQILRTHVQNQVPISTTLNAVVHASLRNEVIRHFRLEKRLPIATEKIEAVDRKEFGPSCDLLDFYVLVEQWPAESEIAKDCVRAWLEGIVNDETKSEIAQRLGVRLGTIRSAVYSFQRWAQRAVSDNE